MFTMGDEVRRTQQGNNNSYCQDNEMNWLDWNNLNKNKELLAFVKKLSRFNLSQKIFQQEHFWNDPGDNGNTNITWHGTKIGQPDWSDNSHSLAYTLEEFKTGRQYHFMINAYWEPLRFEIPAPRKGDNTWYRIIDTHLNHPQDFNSRGEPIKQKHYLVKSRTVVVLKA